MGDLLPLLKARKAGLPVILWVVIAVVVVAALLVSAPTLSNIISGRGTTIQSQEEASETIMNISSGVEDVSGILEDISDSLG